MNKYKWIEKCKYDWRNILRAHVNNW